MFLGIGVVENEAAGVTDRLNSKVGLVLALFSLRLAVHEAKTSHLLLEQASR